MARGVGVAAVRGRMSGPAAGCPVDTGRMSGLWIGDEHDELHGKMATSRQNSEELVDGNRGRDGEKLDPLDAKQIHGSNPTKLHHTNKSWKKIWGYFWI